jgi:hypothetical protein
LQTRDTLDPLPTASTSREVLHHPHRNPKPRWPLSIAAALATSLVLVGFFVARDWPFTQANVIQQLEQVTGSTVQFGSFQRTYFPHLGCIAGKVVLRRGANPQNSTFMTVETLTIQASPAGLFTKHLSLIRLEGAHAVFAPLGSGPSWQPTPSTVVVDDLEANQALLEFTRHDPRAPHVKFAIEQFLAHHLAISDPMRFELQIQIPMPPGAVHVNGTFGPWNLTQVTETPIAGNYSFRQADLSAFDGIRGVLSSDGQFHGPLDSIQIDGTTATPDFNVKSATHKVSLNSAFHAQVDATNGDVTLNQVRATLLQTIVQSQGSIAQHRTEDGKTAALDFAVRSGRIQDLLLLFVSEKQAPLNGTFTLKAKVVIPPDDRPFLKKLQMSGDFGVGGALFTKDQTQRSLEKLSAAGEGDEKQQDDPERVVSDLEGHAVVRNGVATFSDLRFRVPGARARLHGTYDLISHRINLHGTLFMDAQLPKATSGVKSFLLKAVNPFLKKNRRGGAEFPVSISGTYESPSYTADPV